jgi:hypothetical protein
MATKAGFLAFLRAAGFTTVVLPDASTDIDTALALSLEIVYLGILDASPLYYDQAVYNLATSNLIELAQDQTGQTFFSALRTKFNILNFVPGLISSTADENTSESLLNPEFMKKLTIADLQYLKTPYGRAYLAIAQRIGSVWGMT